MFPIASNSDNEKLYVDDVFSTWLYTGNGSTQTITNGIDFAGKGGLVWIKARTSPTGYSNILMDTARGFGRYLTSNDTIGQDGYGDLGWTTGSFNSNGFTTVNGSNATINGSSATFASWSFRKAAKFFDVQTVTHTNGTAKNIDLLVLGTVGMVIAKITSTTGDWTVWQRGLTTGYNLKLNTLAEQSTTDAWLSVAGTTATLSASAPTGTYVIYAYAHDTTSTGIIQCGSYTGNGAEFGSLVNLGWEPQWVLVKQIDNGTMTGWAIVDSMRGFCVEASTEDSGDALLFPYTTQAEINRGRIRPDALGFTPRNLWNAASTKYMYIAIRRPTKPPTSGAQVFSIDAYIETISGFRNVGFAPDMAIQLRRSGDTKIIWDKLRGNTATLNIESTAAENGVYTGVTYPFGGFNNIGWSSGYLYNNQSGVLSESYVFRRAPGFFDVVAFPASGVNQFYNHNLGVAPEFIILKCRNSPGDWYCRNVYVAGLLYLNATNAVRTDGLGEAIFGNGTTYIAPSNSQFYVGGWISSSLNMVAYLFATLAGISKVGSYTGNGSSQNINCGFGSNYSVFVLIKRTDSTGGDWYVWNTARGITASIDPHLSLNTTAAEVLTTNSIDLVSSGFTVIQNSTTNINVTNATYIYLSIASSVSYLTGGEALFTTPGTFYWTCPAGVTEACVVCIGGGGGLGGTYGSGNSGSGAGGALSYLNNYAVTPGTVYTVVVGGAASSSSCFGITAGGGLYYNNRLASSGGTSFNGGDSDGGGGGAGGYTGQGGYGGGQLNSSQSPRNGQGLGAGGGGSGGSANTGTSNAGGGGASLYGGAGGAGGAGGYNTAGNGGAAASTTANNGESGKSGVEYGGGAGGKYGGGGGSVNISGGGYVAGIGASGAVRIIWGSGRSFPYSAG